MTGTAKTEEKEFVEIYNLHVVPIPTNVTVARADKNDFIFKTKDAKFDAVVDDIKERHENGPAGARRHDRGRDLRVPLGAAQAPGRPAQRAQRQGARARGARSSWTPASSARSRSRPTWPAAASTSSSARACARLGGLYVLGTERHESRRIDNQLRGRSGRQGDPGETRFYLSAEDDLVRLFAGDRIYNIMERFKLPDDQPMEAKILSNQIESAQKKVEEQNFVARKNVLKYDDVMNMQREVIYEQRRQRARGRRPLGGDPGAGSTRSSRRPSPSTPSASSREEWDLDGLVARDGGALRHATSRRTSSARRLDLVARRDRRGVPRGRARRLHRARRTELEAARAHARPRALHRAPDRRPALARAPREHGLHARGHPPARYGAEGPARRVPHRGPRDVRGAERDDPRGGRRSRSSTRRSRCSRTRSGAAAAPAQARQRQPPVRARDGRGRGGDRRRAGGGAARAAGAVAGRSATAVAPRRADGRRASTRTSAATTRAGAARGKKFKSCHGA